MRNGGPWIAAAGAFLVAVAGCSSGNTPEGVMERMGAAVEAANPEEFEDLSAPLDAEEESFLGWILAMEADPEFTNCEGTAAVTCDVTMGEDYFFSVLEDDNLASTVTVSVRPDGTFGVMSWPPPEGLVAAEVELRTWIRETHPEEEDRMFGSILGVLKFTEEAGELHMEYLDEYMAYREANA